MKRAIVVLMALCSCGGDAFSAGREQPAVVSPDAAGDDAEPAHDAQGPEASADGAVQAAKDAGHDADPPDAAVDAGVDALEDAQSDVVDAAPDVDPTNPCDAGHCPIGDGAWCVNASYFGCTSQPMYTSLCTSTSWETPNAYICTNGSRGGDQPGCAHPAGQPGIYCCGAFCPSPN